MQGQSSLRTSLERVCVFCSGARWSWRAGGMSMLVVTCLEKMKAAACINAFIGE